MALKKKITIDVGHNIPVYSPVCLFCKHLINADPLIRKCKAFKEIPLKIWTGKNKHTKLYPGQKNDIIFKKK